jgi:HD-GYP domain-containing protein (c-di-GMP phosphodiesterase class II)
LAEYYDRDTGDHLVRIQNYVLLLASWLQNNSPYAVYITRKPDYVNDLKLASLLHDIGKIAIPRAILNKPGKLTEEEFEIVKTHTSIAGEVLNKANAAFIVSFGKDSYLALARDIALYHHEQWNGGGYPHGLKGETIPLSARIVALADVYDALRSVRPYKKAFTHMDAVDIITNKEKEHFDPYVLKAFLAQSDIFCEISSRSKQDRIRQFAP